MELARFHVVDEPGHRGVFGDQRGGADDRNVITHALLEIAEGQEPIEGESATMSVGEAPGQVVNMAVGAARLVGRGLYGVDLKQVEERCYLIEVNCNPNIDAGVEDEVLGEALYREIVGVFARRIAEGRSGAAQPSTP